MSRPIDRVSSATLRLEKSQKELHEHVMRAVNAAAEAAHGANPLDLDEWRSALDEVLRGLESSAAELLAAVRQYALEGGGSETDEPV
jgi:hypothetical protein